MYLGMTAIPYPDRHPEDVAFLTNNLIAKYFFHPEPSKQLQLKKSAHFCARDFRNSLLVKGLRGCGVVVGGN